MTAMLPSDASYARATQPLVTVCRGEDSALDSTPDVTFVDHGIDG